jgi:hypothetical protein
VSAHGAERLWRKQANVLLMSKEMIRTVLKMTQPRNQQQEQTLKLARLRLHFGLWKLHWKELATNKWKVHSMGNDWANTAMVQECIIILSWFDLLVIG